MENSISHLPSTPIIHMNHQRFYVLKRYINNDKNGYNEINLNYLFFYQFYLIIFIFYV